MRDLDLYSGVEAPARDLVPETRAGDARIAGASSRASTTDWIALVWREFPLPIQERYRPVGVAGEGGMGVVLEAHDTRLDRPVAIKGPRDPARLAPGTRQRLAHEAQLHARLAHPNILPVYDAWTDARGLPWCAMLLVPGAAGGTTRVVTLAAWLEDLSAHTEFATRPIAALIEVFLQTCRAVRHAHACGVLHRDLKPANVLLGPGGEALVADWGVAMTLPADPSAAPEVVGTAGYAAPEQLGAAGTPRASERSDIYSLGVILLEMLTGQREVLTVSRLARARRVPRELAAIVARATAPEEQDRFPDVGALGAAVQTYLGGGIIDGMDYTWAERLARRARRHPGAAVGLIAGGLLVLVLVAGKLERDRAVRARLMEAHRNLAISHAGWAVMHEKEGRLEEAHLFAALAHQEALGAPPGFALPANGVHALFAGRTPPGPLVWTARLDGPIAHVHFEPGGRRLSAVTKSGTVYSMDLTGLPVVGTQRLVDETVWLARISADGALAATAGSLPRCLVWRRSFDRPWTRIGEVPRSSIGAIAIAPAADLLATGEEDGAVNLWSLPDLTPAGRLRGPTRSLMCARFSPDGRWLIVADATGQAVVWDVAARAVRTRCESVGDVILDVGFTADGRTPIGAGGGPVAWTWDAASGALARSMSAAAMKEAHTAVYGISASPDGRWIAGAGHDFRVRVWEAASGREVANLAGHTDGVWNVTFSPDGRTLASGGLDGALCLWDVPRAIEAVARRQFTSQEAPRLALTPDGSRLVSSGPPRSVSVLERATGRVLSRYASPIRVDTLALDEEGRPWVARVTPGEGAWVARLGVPLPEPRRIAPAGASRPRFDAAGRRLALAISGDRIAVHELAGHQPPLDLAAPAGGAVSLAFSRDGGQLAAGGKHGLVLIHALGPRGSPPRSVKILERVVGGLAFDATGRHLAAGGEDSTARVVDLSTGQLSAVLQQVGPVRSVAYAPERGLLITGGPVGMSGYRLPGGQKIPELEVPNQPVWSQALTLDGTGLACLRAGQPMVWELDAFGDTPRRIGELVADSLFDVPGTDGALTVRDPAAAPAPRWADEPAFVPEQTQPATPPPGR